MDEKKKKDEEKEKPANWPTTNRPASEVALSWIIKILYPFSWRILNLTRREERKERKEKEKKKKSRGSRMEMEEKSSLLVLNTL
jgi:hypothetical protein